MEIKNLDRIIEGIVGAVILILSLKFRLPIFIGVFIGYVMGLFVAKNAREIKVLVGEGDKFKVEEGFIKECYESYSQHYTNDFIGPSAKTTAEQIIRFEERYKKLKKILEDKFDKDELTYKKFLATVDLVYNSLEENYKKLEEKFDTIYDIDYEKLSSRIEEIKRELPRAQEEIITELNILSDRKNLARETLSEINRIISVNEEIINDIDKLRLKISNLKAKDSRSLLDLDFSRAELDKLIKNTNIYSR